MKRGKLVFTYGVLLIALGQAGLVEVLMKPGNSVVRVCGLLVGFCLIILGADNLERLIFPGGRSR